MFSIGMQLGVWCIAFTRLLKEYLGFLELKVERLIVTTFLWSDLFFEASKAKEIYLGGRGD